MTLSPDMLGLLAPALLAGLIVAATHVPLGQEVLKRGIIFIDLAIAQIAALGVVVSHSLLHIEKGIIPLATAMGFALAGGGLFAWLEQKAAAYQEALIGVVFVLSASVIILLLADNPHGGEEIQSLLAGQILWVDWRQATITGGVYALVLALWFGMKNRQDRLFYFLFPVVVTLSVQLVGVYLVFASLIIPALGAVCFQNKLVSGYIIAALSVTGGLAVSVAADLPAGPVLVCSYAATAIAAAMLQKTIKYKKKG